MRCSSAISGVTCGFELRRSIDIACVEDHDRWPLGLRGLAFHRIERAFERVRIGLDPERGVRVFVQQTRRDVTERDEPVLVHRSERRRPHPSLLGRHVADVGVAHRGGRAPGVKHGLPESAQHDVEGALLVGALGDRHAEEDDAVRADLVAGRATKRLGCGADLVGFTDSVRGGGVSRGHRPRTGRDRQGPLKRRRSLAGQSGATPRVDVADRPGIGQRPDGRSRGGRHVLPVQVGRKDDHDSSSTVVAPALGEAGSHAAAIAAISVAVARSRLIRLNDSRWRATPR